MHQADERGTCDEPSCWATHLPIALFFCLVGISQPVAHRSSVWTASGLSEPLLTKTQAIDSWIVLKFNAESRPRLLPAPSGSARLFDVLEDKQMADALRHLFLPS